MSDRLTIQIFDCPSGSEEELGWRQLKRGDINDAISWEVTKHFAGMGDFALEIPINSTYAEEIKENSVLYVYHGEDTRSGDGYVVKNIVQNADTYKITGYDCNGLLRDRLVVPGADAIEGEGGESYAVVTGSTETCVKKYVTDNCITPADTNRILPRFAVADDLGRGLAEDSNMVRLESVEDVVRRMVLARDMGYRVTMKHDTQLLTQPLFVFDVYEQVDRTANQKERNRVIFSLGHRNITALTYEHGLTVDKSTLYCDNESDATVAVHKYADAPAVGYDRREEYVALQCTIDDIDKYAAREFSDRFTHTDSLTIEAGNPLDYGVLYDVGDVVTVYANDREVQLDSVIASVTTRWTASDYSVRLTLGESKPKLLDNYQKKNSSIQRVQTNNQPVITGGGGGAYTTGIDFNSEGFDLHFADAAGKVQTNTWKWTLDDTSRITLLHNVTANRDIVITYDGEIPTPGGGDIITSAQFDYTTYDTALKMWASRVNSESYTASIVAGTPTVGADYVQLSSTCYASFTIPQKPAVLWCVVHGVTGEYTRWRPLMAASLNNMLGDGVGRAHDIAITNRNFYAGTENGGAYDAISAVASTDGWHAVLFAINPDAWAGEGSPLRLYIDGVMVATAANYRAGWATEAFDGIYYVNYEKRFNSKTVGTDVQYRAFGFNIDYLSHEQCLAMSKALKTQYIDNV